MTQQELHRLSRAEILRLMLAQSRELERLGDEANRTRRTAALVSDECSRLRSELEEKDARLRELADRLRAGSAELAALRDELETLRESEKALRAQLEERNSEMLCVKMLYDRKDEQLSAAQKEMERLRSEKDARWEKQMSVFLENAQELRGRIDGQEDMLREIRERVSPPAAAAVDPELCPSEPEDGFMTAPRAVDWNEYSRHTASGKDAAIRRVRKDRRK